MNSNNTRPTAQAAQEAWGRLVEQIIIYEGGEALPSELKTPEGYRELGRQSLESSDKGTENPSS